MDAALTHPVGAPVLAGIATHVVCHFREPRSLPAYLAVLFAAPLLLTPTLITSRAAPAVLVTFARTLVLYLVALGTSVVLYRLSPLHPLYRYPGPVLARISRLYATRLALDGRQHLATEALIRRYGPIVRTGPNHLHICEVDAISPVQGATEGWWRGERYAALTMGAPDSTRPISFIRDPAVHAPRRKIWDRAFTTPALRAYTPLLRGRCAELLTALAAAAVRKDAPAGGEPVPVDAQRWLSLMALDWMGDFAWGGLFHALADGKDDVGFGALGVRTVQVIQVVGTIPWVGPLFMLLLPARTRALDNAAQDVVNRRVREGARTRDLFTVLLDEDGKSGHAPLPAPTLTAEARVAIVAGSHTTSSTAGHALFYLLTRADDMARLRNELDAAAGGVAADDKKDNDVEGIPLDQLDKLPFLNAVINETLRLRLVIPDGVPRTPPPEGGPAVVASHIIPVGTTVQIPTYSLQRDDRYFAPDPARWWPARWLPETRAQIEQAGGRFALDKRAYMPFHVGWGACVGRAVALRALRAVLAALVRRFELELAPGFDARAWEEEERVLVERKLWVILTERDRKG